MAIGLLIAHAWLQLQKQDISQENQAKSYEQKFRIWRLRRAYRFACSPFMAGFMELKHSERRQLKTAVPDIAEVDFSHVFGMAQACKTHVDSERTAVFRIYCLLNCQHVDSEDIDSIGR